jgi:hypothetical protein
LVGIERIVSFRPRTVFSVLGILILVGVVLYVLWVSRHVVSWLLIALFFALALNPGGRLAPGTRRAEARAGDGHRLRARAGCVAGLAALFVPTLVDQVDSFAKKVPDYITDLTHGRGKLGFLETRTTSSRR